MRAVIIAAGDLDSLPAEIQTVSNTLSAAGWTVRLCIGRRCVARRPAGGGRRGRSNGAPSPCRSALFR